MLIAALVLSTLVARAFAFQGPDTWFTVNTTADITVTNSTTKVNATGLSFIIGANENYEFECVLHVTLVETASSGSGLAVAVTGPASPSSVRYASQFSYSTTVAAGATAFGATVTPIPAGTLNATVDGLASRIHGVVLNGANAGTVQVQFAEATAAASTSTTLKQGSWCKYRRF
jgi:hypothetical protein